MHIEQSNPSALMVRGNAYRAKGDLDHAIDDYTAAINFQPFAQLFHERGVAYRMKGDREHAIDDFKYAVHLLPKDSPDSIAELKVLGIDMSDYDPMKLPKAKDLLKSFK
jgi:tetratricopeptide (TPR) repeat protein